MILSNFEINILLKSVWKIYFKSSEWTKIHSHCNSMILVDSINQWMSNKIINGWKKVSLFIDYLIQLKSIFW